MPNGEGGQRPVRQEAGEFTPPPSAVSRPADTADLQAVMRPIDDGAPARTPTPAPRAATVPPPPASSSDRVGLVGKVQEVVREGFDGALEEMRQMVDEQTGRIGASIRDLGDAVRASEGEVRAAVSGTESNLSGRLDVLSRRMEELEGETQGLKGLCERILRELVG